MKYIVYAMAAMFFLASCSKDNDETGGGNGGGGETGGVTDVTPVTSDLTVNLTTDKACYKPGETVSFTADALPAGAKVRYRTLNKVISEQAVAGSSWTWTAPATDFTGYLADVYRTKRRRYGSHSRYYCRRCIQRLDTLPALWLCRHLRRF